VSPVRAFIIDVKSQVGLSISHRLAPAHSAEQGHFDWRGFADGKQWIFAYQTVDAEFRQGPRFLCKHTRLQAELRTGTYGML